MSSLLLLLLWAASWQGARAAEYRRVTLTNDRTVVAEMGGAEGDHQLFVIPQGTMEVDFAEISSLDVINAVEYEAQRPWRVAVLPFITDVPEWTETADRVRTQVRQELRSLPKVNETAPEGFQGRLDAEGIAALSACGMNAACAAPIARTAGATLVVMGALTRQDGQPTLTLATVWTGAPRAQRSLTVDLDSDPGLDPEPLRDALYYSLHLRKPQAGAVVRVPAPLAPSMTSAAPTPGPTPAPTPAPVAGLAVTEAAPPPALAPRPPRAPPDLAALRRMSWVPVPGFPSMQRGDAAGTGSSLLVALPGTAAMVALVGQSSLRPAGMAGLSALCYYGLTLAVNQSIGLRELTLSAAPLENGGAAVVVGGGR